MVFPASHVSFWSGTLPETNIATENGWLEDDFPFGKPYFQLAMLVFGDVILGRFSLKGQYLAKRFLGKSTWMPRMQKVNQKYSDPMVVEW